jgi:heme-degrading monooxygenase HmoA
MFARKVAARLKPNSLTEFTTLIEHDILPWLRRQEGFLDLITLSAPDGTEVATISFWDHQQNAQAYNSSGYPDALEILEELLDAPPYVKTFEVVHSTFQREECTTPPEAGNPVQKIDRRVLTPNQVTSASGSTGPAPRNRAGLSRRKVTHTNQVKKEAKPDHEKRIPGNWTQADQVPDATA